MATLEPNLEPIEYPQTTGSASKLLVHLMLTVLLVRKTRRYVVLDAYRALNSLWSKDFQRILSPARLPFHHSGTGTNIDNQQLNRMQQRKRLEEELPTFLERADASESGIFDVF